MAIKLAFMGFRHGHIFDLHSRASTSEDFTIVDACEEDAETRESLHQSGQVEITYDDYLTMLEDTECDAVAVGDYYGKRGDIIIAALRNGKHVISDKPICTSLDQLRTIESLSRERRLVVGCMLDMRDNGVFQKVRELVRSGAIGEVHAISFGGQHPLLRNTRPSWYFEEGKHGGTINDIGVHAFDIIPWLTGLEFAEIVAARSWNAFAPDVPHFHDAGQFMLTMSNGCGVLGDVSYFMPDSQGYSLEQFWRFTLFGRDGVLEASMKLPNIRLSRNGDTETELIEPNAGTPGGYMESFGREVRGIRKGLSPSMENVMKASRIALTVQQAGFENLSHIGL